MISPPTGVADANSSFRQEEPLAAPLRLEPLIPTLAMRPYAFVILLGLLTNFLPVASQHIATHSTVQLKSATSSQLLAATQASQEEEKPPHRRTERRDLS